MHLIFYCFQYILKRFALALTRKINKFSSKSCEFDGGDCCLPSCERGCQDSTRLYYYDRPESNNYNGRCLNMCGEGGYECLDDEYIQKSVSDYWCQHGNIIPMSECYYRQYDIASILQQCMVAEHSHGSKIQASPLCGNRSETCTMDDVDSGNGCQLRREECTKNPCCMQAFKEGFISRAARVLPNVTELAQTCQNAETLEEVPCMQYMVKCIQENKAYDGGCCKCDEFWMGPRCDVPMCHPNCKNGECM